MENLKKDEILYVLMPNKTIKTARILEIIREEGKAGNKELNPNYYMKIVVRYDDSVSDGTVTFYPNDMNEIIFETKEKIYESI